MNRLKGLFRDTWWLWLLFFGTGTVLSIFANVLFVVTLPILFVAFIYYAMLRYDDEGNQVGD